MKITTRAFVAGLGLVFLLATTGCGKSKMVGEVKKMVDTVCACKDAKCAGDAFGGLMKWGAAHKDDKVSKSDMEAAKREMVRAGECMKKLAVKK